MAKNSKIDWTDHFMKQMSGITKAQREAIPEHLMVRQFPR